MSVSIEEAYARVQTKYDFPETLKEEQIQCLDLLTHNEDLLCVLPTGYGKSIIYTLIPLLLDEVTFCNSFIGNIL